MLVYEVNVKIDNSIKDAYEQWLPGHIQDLLRFQGFTEANVLSAESDETDKTCLTMHFYVSSKEDLDHYLKNHAPTLRQDGIKRFGEKFTATRRILELRDTTKKDYRRLPTKCSEQY